MNTRLFVSFFVVFFSLFSTHGVADLIDADTVSEDQYFVVVYGYQNGPNTIPASHTFASFIKAPKGSNLSTGKGLEFNDISWLPADFASRLQVDLRLMPEKGKNYSVKETLALVKTKNQLYQRIGMLNENSKTSVKSFGAFPISKSAFETGLGRIQELNSGKISYKVDDARARARSGEAKSPVVNCIHAVSDAFGKPFTGIKHGNEASQLVVKFLEEEKIIDTRAGQNVELSSFIDKMIQKGTDLTDGTAVPRGNPNPVPNNAHR